MKAKKLASITSWIAKIFFQCAFTDTLSYQKKLLLQFIKHNITTEFWKKYWYETIQTIEDFRKQVPLHTYDDLQPYIEKMMAWNKDILWKWEVPFFAKSSWTTAVSKYIPITRCALRKNHFAVPKMWMWMYLASNPEANIFSWKWIILWGRMIKNPYNLSKNNVWDVSAILQQCAPIITRIFRKPSLSVSFMSDFDKKLDAIIDETLWMPITYVAWVPSWITLLLQRIAQRFPQRSISDIWPDLELFLWWWISIAPYKKQLDILFQSSKIKYRQTYNASEWFFAIQDKADRNDMLLATQHHVFYEFIPFDQIHLPHPHVLTLSQLEIGKRYELIITTDGGLRRYRIWDVIEVTWLDPVRIRIAWRTKSFLNAFGEELMVHTTDTAIQYACEQCNLPLAEYIATAVVENQWWYHQWYIDFGKEVTVNQEWFTNALEEYIQSHNSDYAAKRKWDILMTKLHIQFLQPWTFHKYLESKGKLWWQHKMKRLRNEREELIKEMGEYLGDSIK